MKRFIVISACSVAMMASAYGQPLGSLVIDTIVGSALRGDGGPATSAQLLSPLSVAFDAAGDLYIADTGIIRKVTPDGTITTFAGVGIGGFGGDGGQATAAHLGSTVGGVTVDASGNVYIADTSNNRIRMVAANGVITTVAGGGPALGDGGPPTAAGLSAPYGVKVDSAGNIYISSSGDNRIRKIAGGVISTIAGTGTAGFNGDGPKATSQQLSDPYGISLDAVGNLYIADRSNHRIRKLTPAGAISTIAGSTRGNKVTPSPLTSQLQFPSDVFVSPAGDLYIDDQFNHLIRFLSASGEYRNLAGGSGLGGEGFSGDGQSATSAQLNYPFGITLDAAGNLYIADEDNRRIRKVTVAGVITTIAGSAGNPETPASAELGFPDGVAVAGGNLYIADNRNQIVRKLTPDGTLTTIAGTGVTDFSGESGPATSSALAGPNDVAVDGSGNVYIADEGNLRVRRVTSGGVMTTFAGSGGAVGFGNAVPFSGDGGPATSAILNNPAKVAVDASGNVYIADQSNQRIRKVTTNGIINTIAGNGTAGFSGDNGLATQAELNSPTGVAVDGTGNVYVADINNHRIRKITSGGVISTVAGTGTAGFSGDGGPATVAALRSPRAVALDFAGNLYIADTSNNRIRKVTSSGTISTIAGSGGAGFSGDGGSAAQAQLTPYAIAADADGTLYVADYNNQRIRIIQSASITPSAVLNAASLLPGAVAPGEMITINGLNIGPAALTTAQPDASGLIEASLAQTQVLFDGTPAAIIDVQASQIHAVVPYELAGGQTTTRMQVVLNGKKTNAVSLGVAATDPGLYTLDSSGAGQAMLNNADGTQNAAGNPATGGDVVTLFGTGEGQTNPFGVDGMVAADVLPQPFAPVSVTIGGADAPVVNYGAVPNQVAGSFQVSVMVPSGIAVGSSVPVVLTVGSASSQPGVTMALQ